MINTINPDYNFWELYPDLKYMNPYKDLYKSDKSKSKKDSSVMMWFIALSHAKVSKFRSAPLDGPDSRYIVVGTDYCDDPEYYTKHVDKLESLIQAFIEHEYTLLERDLLTWEEVLNKRTAFIKLQSYTLETYDDLDKMAANTSKIYDTIKKLKDEINKEDATGIGKAGAQASLND